MGLFGRSKFDKAFAPYEMPQEGLLSAPEQQMGFWQGGDKFRARDGIAGLLAAVGDAFSRNGGGQGGAVEMLSGGRMKAMELARKQQEQAQQQELLRARMKAAGLPDNEIEAQLYGFDLPKPVEPPAMIRNLEAFRTQIKPDPQKLADFKEYQSITNPKWFTGADGRPYQMDDRADGPQPGTIEDGYQFMGGDPADPKNWKAVGGGTGNGVGGFRRR